MHSVGDMGASLGGVLAVVSALPSGWSNSSRASAVGVGALSPSKPPRWRWNFSFQPTQQPRFFGWVEAGPARLNLR
eukprot:7752616-Pyramimonas_sp.AAC.1